MSDGIAEVRGEFERDWGSVAYWSSGRIFTVMVTLDPSSGVSAGDAMSKLREVTVRLLTLATVSMTSVTSGAVMGSRVRSMFTSIDAETAVAEIDMGTMKRVGEGFAIMLEVAQGVIGTRSPGGYVMGPATTWSGTTFVGGITTTTGTTGSSIWTRGIGNTGS